jgi:lysophospholipase L1-like esterase
MPRKKLSILCFGDSLTSGYICHGLESHSYAHKLEDRLTGTFPEVDFDIVVNGYPGDIASSERFSSRLKAACM